MSNKKYDADKNFNKMFLNVWLTFRLLQARYHAQVHACSHIVYHMQSFHSIRLFPAFLVKEGKEMLYLTTHSRQFIYGYVASDMW